jgi:hypothetical protein
MGQAISRNSRQTFTEQYMSGEDLINRPDIWYKVFPYLKEEINMVDFMIQTGRKERTIQSTFNWHEEDILIPIAEIGVVAGTPGAGNPVTITIKQISTDNEIPFKKWDTVKVGAIRGWIASESDITIDASGGLHEYVITPVKNTDDIVTAAVVDDFVVWYGSAKADGQNQPDSMISKPIPFSGQTQIIATNYTTHGSAAANEAFIQTRSGKWFFYYRGVEQAIVRHKMAIALTILMGESSVGLSDTAHPDGTTPVRTTMGMERRMTTYGNPQTGTQFDFTEFEDVNNALDENFAPDQFAVFVGNVFKNQWDNMAFDRNYYDAAASYGMFHNAVLQGGSQKWGEGDPKQKAIDLGFDSIKRGIRSYHVKQEPTLYYKNVTGATGQPYPNMGIFLPVEMVRDPSSGEYYNSIAIRYKASDREDRMIQEWVRDKTTDDYDKFRFNHLSEIGWQQARLRQSVIWTAS